MLPPIVIPAYKPGQALIQTVEALVAKEPDRFILVVNDGSPPSYNNIFQAIDFHPQVTVLSHPVNLGKGQALKTAFNHILTDCPADCPGVVTADADGQHLPEDIEKVSADLYAEPNALILGARAFGPDVPLRSKIGNIVTRNIFSLLTRRAISDTQTGLRGIPRDFLKHYLKLPASGYDYELEMLLETVRKRLPFKEIFITTVYEQGNVSSHFNPVLDSLKIYYVLLRFSGLSAVSAGLDYLVFSILFVLTNNLLLSTALARIASGVFNFTLARKFVFKSNGELVQEALRYAALATVLLLLSYSLISFQRNYLETNVYLGKIIAETLLFIFSFSVQDIFVFSSHDPTADELRATDWDSYYKSAVIRARVTRRLMEKKLLALAGRFAGGGIQCICELGGANSCFYDAFRRRYPKAAYLAVDTSRYGLDLLASSHPDDSLLETIRANILAEVGQPATADLVYSVGLIDHFNPDDTMRAIQAHFRQARPGAIVLLCFSTPTRLYRLTRRLLEMLGLWAFPDERPVPIAEAAAETERHGELLYQSINWAILLTQATLVVRVA